MCEKPAAITVVQSAGPVIQWMALIPVEKYRGGQVVSTPEFRLWGPGFVSCWRWNSAYDCTALHCTEPFIIIFPLSRYDLNIVKKDVKCQIMIVPVDVSTYCWMCDRQCRPSSDATHSGVFDLGIHCLLRPLSNCGVVFIWTFHWFNVASLH